MLIHAKNVTVQAHGGIFASAVRTFFVMMHNNNVENLEMSTNIM